jgi:hypothetical protein
MNGCRDEKLPIDIQRWTKYSLNTVI